MLVEDIQTGVFRSGNLMAPVTKWEEEQGCSEASNTTGPSISLSISHPSFPLHVFFISGPTERQTAPGAHI